MVVLKQPSTSSIPIRVSCVQLFGTRNNSVECCFEEVKRGGRGVKNHGWAAARPSGQNAHTRSEFEVGSYEPANRLSLKFETSTQSFDDHRRTTSARALLFVRFRRRATRLHWQVNRLYDATQATQWRSEEGILEYCSGFYHQRQQFHSASRMDY